jgi:transmembrane sensor
MRAVMTAGEASAMEEATRWLLRSKETLSPEEQAQLLQWLRAQPENAAALDIVSRSWEIAGEAAHTKAVVPELLRARRLSLTGRPQHRHSRPQRATWIGMRAVAGVLAATLLLALAGIVWNVMSVRTVYATGRGNQLSTQLADGTRLRLDATTRLEVHFDPFRRRDRKSVV